MYLVIAEKPSVAQSIAKVIGAYETKDGFIRGNGCMVSWCLGHLAEYAQPEQYDAKYMKWLYDDLPILPEGWKLIVDPQKKKQMDVLKELLNREDMEYVVNACDAGREGELIFKRMYELTGSKVPVKRLWISSMEDEAIRDGFRNLKDDSEYLKLYEAAVCRAKADWLVGLNATRAFTTKYGKKLVIGRVQTPTLAMIAERQKSIVDFRKAKYYNVELYCDGLKVTLDKIQDDAEAHKIRTACEGQKAFVEKIHTVEKTVQPPKLYDLTTLQRDSNRLYGYTAAKTLNYTQSLYEKKLVTYPRTDSQYLTDDMGETVENVISLVREDVDMSASYTEAPDIKRVSDSRKVSDHHAIIPTAEIRNFDMENLTKGERDILTLIINRLLCATAGKHVYEESDITVSCSGYEFKTRCRTIKVPGWKAVEESFRRQKGIKEEEEGFEEAPAYAEGEIFSNIKADVTEHYTSPPKAFTEELYCKG